MTKEELAKRIKERRENVGMPVNRLAALCGVTDDVIKTWESGKRAIPAHHLYCLAKALTCSANWLVGLDET